MKPVTHDERGREIVDSTPLEIPAHLRRAVPLKDQIRMMIRQTLSQEAASVGAETFEESIDFEVDDEESFESELTPYQRSAEIMETEVPKYGEQRAAERDLARSRKDGGAEGGGRSGDRDADEPHRRDQRKDDSRRRRGSSDDGRRVADGDRGGKGRDTEDQDLDGGSRRGVDE